MRRLTNEPLHVETALIGAQLASPARRVFAFVIDGALLIIPSVAVAVLAAAISLQVTEPRGAHAIYTWLTAPRGAAARTTAMRELVPLLVRLEAPGLPAAAKAAVEEGDLTRAADTITDYNLSFSLQFHEGSRREISASQKVVVLEIADLIPGPIRAIALLGVPALYFVFFTRSRRGATPGKWLLGIRVARLDGERLTWLESLERFVGYVHIPGTLFLSLADLWRDPNRRLPHDRAVHTAVFRVRRHAQFPPAHLAAV